MEPPKPDTLKAIIDAINAFSTLVIAIATVVTTVITRRMLRETKKAFELTRRSVELSARMKEADLVFRDTEQNPDGTARFGAERSSSRLTLYEYLGKVRQMVKELEGMKM